MIDIQTQLEPLRNWYDKLEKREQIIVSAGAIILGVMLIYLLAWDPVISTLDEEKQKYESNSQLYFWMQDAASEYRSLKSSGAQTNNRFKNQSISSLAERSAQSAGIKQFISKLDSDSKGVKAELNQVSFDSLVIWLSDLSNKYNIQTSGLHIEKLKEPGTVKARITLERTSS